MMDTVEFNYSSQQLSAYVGKVCRIRWTNTGNVSDYFIVSVDGDLVTMKMISVLPIRPSVIHRYHINEINEIPMH